MSLLGFVVAAGIGAAAVKVVERAQAANPDSKPTVDDYIKETKAFAEEVGEKAAVKAQEVAPEATEKAKEALKSAKEAAPEVKEKAKEAAKEAVKAAKETLKK